MTSIVSLIRAIFYLSVAAIIVGSPTGSQAATRYPLTCRGGDGFFLRLYHGGTASIRNVTNKSSDVTNHLTVKFQRAPVASSQGLLPGECAWADRPVAGSEPNVMCLAAPRLSIELGTNEGGFLTVVQTSVLLGQENVDDVIYGLRSDWQYQTFWVYNDGRACLRF